MKNFENVKNRQPGRSVFDLSYEKKFNCDMGQLIPVVCDEAVPGDRWTIGNELVIRLQPLVAPVMHNINAIIHYFFVPYRLLWDKWEDFITGGVDGLNADVLPRWTPSSQGCAKYSLWDYLGFPVDIAPTGRLPMDFPRSAYAKIYNDFYRDETLQEEKDLNQETILLRSWQKDYFTSALPWQQRGIAVALPVTGQSHAEFQVAGANANPISVQINSVEDALYNSAKNALDKNVVDLNNLSTFDVADLRLAFQIQKWMERNARAGVRYTESLKAHFGVSPRDDRLQRAEYITGTKQPVIISEVLQTSGTPNDGNPDPNTTYTKEPLGTMGGHGISVNRQQAGTYNVLEHGLIMGLLSIMPEPTYQQGINRQWLRETKYDFFWPEFVNLSEQAIERVEIYASAVESENKTLFGYQGRYDELRYKPSMVAADFRDVFNYWHLGRIFSSPPALNEDFIQCLPQKRIFAVQSEPGFMVQIRNIIKAIRPLPVIAEPGMIDH